MPSGSRWL
jgi:hypothetical protein